MPTLFACVRNSPSALLVRERLNQAHSDFWLNVSLWRLSWQIAVGRLGVITEMELSLIPQDMVTRVVTNMDFWEFVQALHQLQDDYNAALNGTGAQTVAQVLASYEGTQVTADLYSLHAPREMHQNLLDISVLGRPLAPALLFSLSCPGAQIPDLLPVASLG